MSDRVHNKGRALKRLSGSTYVLIPGLDVIPLNFGETEEVETTAHDDATAGFLTFIAGWKDGGELPCEGFWDDDETQHQWLLTNNGGAAQSFQIDIPTASGTSTYAFSALIKNLDLPDDIKSAERFTVTLRVSGAVTGPT